jgi:prolyl 4-hydroxylase
MQKFCAPSCGTCHSLDPKFRCPINDTEPEALTPGDLDKMFQRIINFDYYKQFEPSILSMPNPTQDQKEGGVVDGPWVVVLDKFLTYDECDRLIELGAIEGYKESADVGKKNFDGTYEKSVNSGRTSTNAWCNSVCHEDEVARRVNDKISNLTGIPEANAEHLQLLRYEPGQFYNTHHDYIPHHLSRQMGVRTLTVFLYLNDVEAGGGTEFPNIGLTVQPRKGRAVIWPSVLNENPNAKDLRTNHGALPVQSGIKYGANAWIHQRDFKSVLKAGCT